MRFFIVGAALLLTSTAAAQSRWTLSAGPEWQSNIGARLRGEYDLVKPDQPLRLRLELGGYWEPSQLQLRSYAIPENGSVALSSQSVDFMFGLTVSLTPLPRARIAPYVTVGALGRQVWAHGKVFIATPDSATHTNYAETEGQLLVPRALGVRARLGARLFQVEIRRLEHRTAVMVGTNLPF